MGKVFEGEKESVIIAKIDADSQRDTAARFGISGFPTLKYFPAGAHKDPIDCNHRDLPGLVDFINTHAGTARNADGSLTEAAGRIAALDEIVSGETLDSLILVKLKSAVAQLQGKEASYGAIYVSVAEKVLEKGKAYVESEKKRVSGMISNKSINPSKKVSFALKRNILSAFASS